MDDSVVDKYEKAKRPMQTDRANAMTEGFAERDAEQILDFSCYESNWSKC